MLFNCGVGEDAWESLVCKEIQPVNPKGNQSCMFIGRTDAEAPMLQPPDANCWLIGKDPEAGKDWRQEEKGMTENEIVGWHHWLDGHEFEKASVVGDGQGVLVCCSPRVHKESDVTEWLNCTELDTSIKCLLKILHGLRNISKCNQEQCLAFPLPFVNVTFFPLAFSVFS